jgi:hypothetical protein
MIFMVTAESKAIVFGNFTCEEPYGKNLQYDSARNHACRQTSKRLVPRVDSNPHDPRSTNFKSEAITNEPKTAEF